MCYQIIYQGSPTIFVVKFFTYTGLTLKLKKKNWIKPYTVGIINSYLSHSCTFFSCFNSGAHIIFSLWSFGMGLDSLPGHIWPTGHQLKILATYCSHTALMSIRYHSSRVDIFPFPSHYFNVTKWKKSRQKKSPSTELHLPFLEICS